MQKMFATSFATFTMNATLTKLAHPFYAPKTGNITAAGMVFGTVTSSQSVSLSIQALDGSGNADGTPIGAAGTQGTIATGTGYDVTITSSAVTEGTKYAVVQEWTGTTGTAVVRATSVTGIGDIWPYVAQYSSGSWSTRTASTVLQTWVKYDDGIYYPIGASPWSGTTSGTNLSSSTTPDEVGNRFSFAVPVQVCGASVRYNHGASADMDIVLYSGTTALTSATVRAVDVSSTGAGQRWVTVHFASPQQFAANAAFRIVLKPTTTNNSTYDKWVVLSNGILGGRPGGINVYGTSRTDAGSFTDVTTDVYPVIPIVNQVSDGVGGGGAILFGGSLVQ